MEDYGWVVDFLPEGKATERLREPMAQLVGEKNFTLLEVAVKQDVKLSLGQRLYIGKDERGEVAQIKRRIGYDDLTAAAHSELPAVVRKIIEANSADYLGFFNKAGPISIRLHQLELIPGIGKKHMEQLLDERDAKPFADFEDIKRRVALMQDPVHLLTQRIVEELRGDSKYYIFARPPARREEFGGFRG